jgi:hypothetical protein
MAGGIWRSQNKVRPGAYINFKQVPTPLLTVGDRGIAIIATTLPWGEEGSLIEVFSSDLLDGTSRKLLGFTAFDQAESKIARLMLSNCYKVLFYRLNTTGAAKAAATANSIGFEAKYTGSAGNKITIQISESANTAGLFTVSTFWDGLVVDSQQVRALSEIVDNDYVVFDTTDINAVLDEVAGIPLTGGTDGTVTNETAYPAFFAAARVARWQCMAVISDYATVNPLAKELVQQMREDDGRKVQVAVFDDATLYDYEGVISSDQGVTLSNGDVISKYEFPAYVAAVTAGAQINESNTYKIVENAVAYAPVYTDSQIKDRLANGKFTLSTRSDGEIVIELDINSYHLFSATKGYPFSKNRIIRGLDEIAISVLDVWERNYAGKTTNNEDYRAIFKADVVAYVEELKRMDVIEKTYDANANIEIKRGTRVNAVYVKMNQLPVLDSMEILYMDVEIAG